MISGDEEKRPLQAELEESADHTYGRKLAANSSPSSNLPLRRVFAPRPWTLDTRCSSLLVKCTRQ